MILHIQRDAGHAVQFGRTYNQNSGWPMVTRVRNTSISNAWQPWEWLTPPMELGVEYRTTERYLGKPVYTQIKQFDNLTTEQSFYPGGDIIRYSGEYQWPYGDDTHWTPGMPTRQPGGAVEGNVPNIDFGIAYNTGLRLIVNAGSEIIGKSARVQVWYTK